MYGSGSSLHILLDLARVHGLGIAGTSTCGQYVALGSISNLRSFESADAASRMYLKFNRRASSTPKKQH